MQNKTSGQHSTDPKVWRTLLNFHQCI